MTHAFNELLNQISVSLQIDRFDVNGLLAVTLVGLVCGLVGSLVVGNRMAFFSDAMAHCAFAGAAFGVLSIIIAEPQVVNLGESELARWLIPLVMVAFGALVGLGIAYYREKSGLTTDSVIGVFFAFAVGFGAMLIPELSKKVRFDSEAFLFGSPVFATPQDLLLLIGLSIVTIAFLFLRYNDFVFASYNPSLARSRRIRVQLNNYLFVLLLTLVVNLSIRAVGVLLINALLVVPAASAANLARNSRQLFLLTLSISLGSALIGYYACTQITVPIGMNRIELRPSGTIVVLTVISFFVCSYYAVIRGRRIHGASCEC